MSKQFEVMAPAGSWESLRAALQAKADSVYFGLGDLNMRSHAAHNFTFEDLPNIVSLCKEHGVKSYVTLNAILYDEDLIQMQKSCRMIKESGADAVIASDIAAIQYAHSIGLSVHASTQLNICNLDAVRFFSRFVDVVVLARELSLDQIRSIVEGIHRESIRGPKGHLIQIELFVHGALCVSISGKCHMSLVQHNQSANRGRCTQPCRRRYRVIDEETESELVLDNQYVMSPKDLCTIHFIDQLLHAGVEVFKIEGRGRSPDYVHTVVTAYREALESAANGSFTQEKRDQWSEKLKTVYNRGFWEGGYYLGNKLGEWSNSSGSKATKRKVYIGRITNYFSQLGVAECKIETGSLQLGDTLLVTGETTGVVETELSSLHSDHPDGSASKEALVSFPVPQKVRRNDKLYILETIS